MDQFIEFLLTIGIASIILGLYFLVGWLYVEYF